MKTTTTQLLKRVAFLGLGLAALGCGGPTINNVSVTPATVKLSGIADTDTFKVSADVLHFTANISSVQAMVEGQNITVNLAKSGGVLGDEQWSGTAELTLWKNISNGVYQVDIVATDTDGRVDRHNAAASVTVTQ